MGGARRHRLRVDVVSIFPEMLRAMLGTSILGRGQGRGLLHVVQHDLRDYTSDRRRTVDDRPYGGGPGMVMKPEPIFKAVEAIRAAVCARHTAARRRRCSTILMSPQGERLTAALAQALAQAGHLIVLCGHYEGVDERVRAHLVGREVSIGDYVLTGGELPALVLIDAIARFVPGVIGHAEAAASDSFSDGLLEHPQYTRPPDFRGLRVPEVLLRGHHEEIARWRAQQALSRTVARRPDLLQQRRQARSMPSAIRSTRWTG
jgi:tRNA (guanine37-N1)-methyltransferase